VAVSATDHNKLGTTVADRYRLRRVLGRGGMGIVYEAEDETTHRRVAIKVMHPENQVSADNVRRFMNEAHTAGRVQHPNIVEVLDAGQDADDGSLYIVLELLTGIDLATYLTRYDRLLPSETITVVSQVLQALIVAHAAGVVHRDIKPENIFLARGATGDIHVKIVDFGISKVLNPEHDINLSITQTNTTVGTPHYMSPEQAKGEPIDPRADIWALGVVMYECLTGQLPFDGENFNTQIVAVVTEAHKPATAYAVDEALSAIVDRCLQKDRNQRYGSGAEMLDALRHWLDAHPHTGVRASLLKVPSLQELAAAAKGEAPPTDEARAEFGGQDTIDQLPVFPGMVPIDEETQADNMPTTVRAVVSGGLAPRPLSQRPGAYRSDPPPALGTPPSEVVPLSRRTSRPPPPMSGTSTPPGDTDPPPPVESEPVERPGESTGPVSLPPSGMFADRRRPVVFVGAALLAAVAAAGVGAMVSKLHTRPAPVHALVRIRFVGLRAGAQPFVGGVRYYSQEAYVPRGREPLSVRILAEGFQPIEFELVPERDQDVALPVMLPAPAPVPAPAAPPAPTAPAPSRPTAVRSPAGTAAPAAVQAAPTPAAAPAQGARAASAGETGRLSVGASTRCRVSIDGADVGDTPVYHRTVPSGEHLVQCVRQGVPTASQRVTVPPGRDARVLFDDT
jgi:serine/threonine protein kinase